MTQETIRSKTEFEVIDELPGKPRHDIRPNDIKVQDRIAAGSFGKAEVEETAGRLMKFFQARGWWVSFSIMELAEFYKEHEWDPNHMFFGLLGTWFDNSMMFMVIGTPWARIDDYLVIGSDGRYRVTALFIEKCAAGN